jgi:hypothetical protein
MDKLGFLYYVKVNLLQMVDTLIKEHPPKDTVQSRATIYNLGNGYYLTSE